MIARDATLNKEVQDKLYVFIQENTVCPQCIKEHQGKPPCCFFDKSVEEEIPLHPQATAQRESGGRKGELLCANHTVNGCLFHPAIPPVCRIFTCGRAKDAMRKQGRFDQWRELVQWAKERIK